ncbi:YqhA family protein [Ichthyenterobacterium magnum]|uniref:Putative membrane protein YqhA n=1 Tax=Ichthyenterobacterium magnum TaxID=1230530 RepID=A0A420DLU7_9FLAO|nr:YqhA family protein [Ichthyenterobacterium magnum]RKE95264.1 putative membrane protein YqhA [Ichthyenterobacterium magnum]
MKKTFYLFRYISWISIIGSLLGSLLLFVVGALKTFNAFRVVLFDYIPKDKAHLHTADIATTYLIKSLDTFLIALVLFIFAHGVYTLFISNKKYDDGNGVLKWIRTPNIGHLKNVLAEVIVIILFVKFLEVVFVNIDNLKWEILILPASILLLALGLKFLSLNKEEISNEK